METKQQTLLSGTEDFKHYTHLVPTSVDIKYKKKSYSQK